MVTNISSKSKRCSKVKTQSDDSQQKVGKLSFQAHWHVKIIEVIGYNCYSIKISTNLKVKQ